MLPRRSADRARRRDPVRPVPAQHVPRPCRAVRDRSRWRSAIAKARGRRAASTSSSQPTSASFLYMPFQHSEKLDDQNRAVLLFTELGDDEQLGLREAAPRHHRALRPLPAPQRDPRPGAAPRRNRGRRGHALVSGLVEAARFNWAYRSRSRARSTSRAKASRRSCSMPQSNGYSDGAMVGVRLMVLDEDLGRSAAAAARLRALKQMRDRAGVEPGLIELLLDFLRRRAFLALARARTASAERVPERQKASSLPSSALAQRLLHRLDVGRADAADDRARSGRRSRPAAAAASISEASGWPGSSPSGRLLTSIVTPCSASPATSCGAIWPLTSVRSSSWRIMRHPRSPFFGAGSGRCERRRRGSHGSGAPPSVGRP